MRWSGKGLLSLGDGRLVKNGEIIPEGALAPERIALFKSQGKIESGSTPKPEKSEVNREEQKAEDENGIQGEEKGSSNGGRKRSSKGKQK